MSDTDHPQQGSPPGQGRRPSGQSRRPVTVTTLARKKADREPIVMVTAYDFPSAAMADEAGVDVILVGDSAANCVLGYSSTVPIGLDEMIMLAAAVRRGATTSLIVVDLPFGSYEASDEQAVTAAQRVIKSTGADAVKIEGGGTSATRAGAIIDAGIPVMGHIGLTPQSASALGGLKAQARSAATADRLLNQAASLEQAGCFAVVLEAVPAAVAEAATAALRCPTIGIGAGRSTDGQVLVFHDLLGITAGKPAKFVKTFADVRTTAVEGLSRYAHDVRERNYPGDEHTYAMPAEELGRFDAARRPEWIVFDFGNVLSTPDAGPPAVAELLGLDLQTVAPAYWRNRSGYDLNDESYWPGMLAELGVDAPIRELVRADNDAWLELDPGAAALLDDLAATSLPLAVLSNASTPFGADLRKTATGALFSEIVISGDVQLAKPDDRIYRDLLERLGADPAKIVFFDDRQDNVDAARRFGIDAILWTSAAAAREQLRARGIRQA